jgi:hypothetical protein
MVETHDDGVRRLGGRKWVHACLPFSSAVLGASRLIVPAANRLMRTGNCWNALRGGQLGAGPFSAAW